MTIPQLITAILFILALSHFRVTLANERKTKEIHGVSPRRIFSSETSDRIVFFEPLRRSGKSSSSSQESDEKDPLNIEISETERAAEWLSDYNTTAESVYYENNEANWIYNTNITDYNLYLANEADTVLSEFQQEGARNASKFDLSHIQDGTVKRLLKKIATVGIKLNATESFELSALIGNMTGVYSTATICSMNGRHEIDCSKRWLLEPDLDVIFSTSTDYELLEYVWKEWRNAAGRPIRKTYKKLVELSNKGARADGFKDTGEYWRSWYEDELLEKEVEKLWYQVLPLYEQLYAYVRKVLRDRIYGPERIKNVLPAHILGNMWAQEWTELLNFTVPFPGKQSVDVSASMVAQNYTPLKMFQTADKFFQSLGLIPMPDSFYRDSMIEKPTDREVVCHASSWDFYNRRDFRIKMCTKVDMPDLVTVHHEMGHTQYHLQYADQPLVFREGANPGFHEAIGDTMALAVSTPKHLQEIGLLSDYEHDHEQDINFLYKTALDKIAFLPFGYLIDLWRWKVFSEEYKEDEWNEAWWRLRYKYQGLKPPVARTKDDFDAGAKFHVSNNTPYIRYFVAHILQFQFYQSMCTAAGHEGPLHQCDFYKNKEAGAALAKMLQMGNSRPWPDALEAFTGQRSMSAEPIIEYFRPLIDWLKEQNQGECFGWGYQWPSSVMKTLDPNRCTSDDVQTYLDAYNERAKDVYNQFVWSQWNYWTNITDETQKKMDAASVEKDQFDQREMEAVKRLNISHVTDQSIIRQVKKIGAVGLALDDEDSAKFHNLVSQMNNIYSVAFVCNRSTPDCQNNTDPKSKWSFDPTLNDLMAKSRDYDLLVYIWKGWHDASGGQMLDLFKQYVNVGNQGAVKAGYADMGDSWRSQYEDPHFQQQCQDLWRQILPLYEHLHAYIRRRLLSKFYPGRFNTSAIPAHLLGNMWGQEWGNLFDDTAPYPDQPSVDVTPTMIKQGYTPKRMFQTAEDFFHSIGLFKMTEEFWQNSMLERPKERNVDCWADAEEFYNGKDFGIKMCATTTMADLIVIHHEMGHIEYFMSYSKQPIKFHEGANPGFHEAIGDTVALSVSTPGHLQKIGLLSGYDPSSEEAKKQNVNHLYKTALEKIAFLPFGYLIDQFRWQVFDGTIPLDKMNDGWWSARYAYQGLLPPVPRSNLDFDPGAKYHVAADVPYISYFVAHILQFQFHRALCQAAGHTGPLYTCDIYNNTDAGNLLKMMLELGSSVPWPEALKRITGSDKMDASALTEYFGDLIDWLNKTNTENGECYGWGYEWPLYYDLPLPRCGKELPSGKTNTASIIVPNFIGAVIIVIVTILLRKSIID